MNTNLTKYVFHKKKFLEESFCKNSVNELNKSVWSKHDWQSYSGSRAKPAGNDESEVIYHQNYSPEASAINTFIIDSLQSALLEYIKNLKFAWFQGWQGFQAIKFIRYSQDQTMENHCDHIYSLFDGKRKGIPILSIIGTLNDDYEGGEFIMFDDKKIDIKTGDLLIFPSNFLYPHKVTPILKGVRHSYVSWVW